MSLLYDFVDGSLRYFDNNKEGGVLVIDEESRCLVGVGSVILNIKEGGDIQNKVVLYPAKIISFTSLYSSMIWRNVDKSFISNILFFTGIRRNILQHSCILLVNFQLFMFQNRLIQQPFSPLPTPCII